MGGNQKKQNRYNQTNFVPAPIQRDNPRLEIITAEQPPIPFSDTAFTAHDGAKEATSARDRAIGLLIRVAPITALLGLLATFLGRLAGLTLAQSVILFAALAVGGFLLFNAQEYAHSRAGVERHRIDKAAELARLNLHYQNQLRRQALKAYLRHLEQKDDKDE